MAKFLKTTVVALGALLLSTSIALAQATPPPSGTDAGKTPTSTQTVKKRKKNGKKKSGTKKKGTKKPATTTPPPQ